MSVSSSTVTITAVAAGSVTVTVRASDGAAYAEQTIAVTVNTTPGAVGSIPDQTVSKDKDPATVLVGSYFSDPDGNALTYTAKSSAVGVATVAASGETVTITGVALGKAVITVTASDGEDSDTQTIKVTVVENQGPKAVGTIPAQTVKVNGNTILSLGSYFDSVDGDTLTYAVASDDDAKATVKVSSNGLVTIRGVAAGAATVTATVTESDKANLTATQIFTVTVTNRAPETVGTVPSQTVAVGRNAKTVDVSSYFRDPDGDSLNYTASSSDGTKATVDVSGSTVSIAAVAVGSATITVTASDGTATATQTISVTVNAHPNRAPTAVGSIPAMTASVSKGAETVDVSGNFSDADGDTLTYTASSSAKAKATVSVSSATVTITPVAAGSTTVTVTASDGALSTTQTIAVTVVSNRAPTAKGSIPAQTLTAGRGCSGRERQQLLQRCG